MSTAEIVSLVGVLVGVLLMIVALLVWQEARRRPSYEPLEYVVNDAVKHISERLGDDSRLRNADIRRIIEWEVFYLQGLAQEDRKKQVETVAGGHDASVEYIADQIRTKHSVSYSHNQIEEVLRLEADYLMAIGAVGDPVGEEE
ncbi:MAG TPA: hypothetical protein VE569_09230 [Acidimicrobiia bacterium]|jgi:hypothetical protein|nr:hypothetical protein [Acidimicrobiia bacterium]